MGGDGQWYPAHWSRPGSLPLTSGGGACHDGTAVTGTAVTNRHGVDRHGSLSPTSAHKIKQSPRHSARCRSGTRTKPVQLGERGLSRRRSCLCPHRCVACGEVVHTCVRKEKHTVVLQHRFAKGAPTPPPGDKAPRRAAGAPQRDTKTVPEAEFREKPACHRVHPHPPRPRLQAPHST